MKNKCPYCKNKHPIAIGRRLGKKSLTEYFHCSSCGNKYYNYYPLNVFVQYGMSGVRLDIE